MEKENKTEQPTQRRVASTVVQEEVSHAQADSSNGYVRTVREGKKP